MMKQLSISAAILTISLCANAQSPGLPKDVKNMLDSLKQSQQAPQNSTGSAQQASGAKAVDINPADLTRKILRVAAVPSTVEYTGNDWSILKEQFPLQTFSNGTDKTYTDVKTTTIKTKSAEITITAKGARSMILSVDAEAFNKSGDYFGFRDYLNKSNIFRKVCSLDESASFSDIYYEYSENVKPILIHYQFSSGSGGGTETIQVGNQTLPKECKKISQNSAPNKSQTSTKSLPANSLSNRIEIPIDLHGKFYINSKKECVDEAAGWETLLQIEPDLISFGNIASCQPKSIKKDKDNYVINTTCGNGEGGTEKRTIMIIKTPEGVTVGKTKYKKC